jgi:hypothetical protein
MSKPKGVGSLITSWDESEIFEGFIESVIEDYEIYDLDKAPTREEAIERVQNWDMDDDWRFMTEELDDYLCRIIDSEYWHGVVKGFGWRRLDGEKYFKAYGSRELLQAVLPDTDVTFYIYKYKNGIAINNFHHDAPTGEWYFITPVTAETYERKA